MINIRTYLIFKLFFIFIMLVEFFVAYFVGGFNVIERNYPLKLIFQITIKSTPIIPCFYSHIIPYFWSFFIINPCHRITSIQWFSIKIIEFLLVLFLLIKWKILEILQILFVIIWVVISENLFYIILKLLQQRPILNSFIMQKLTKPLILIICYLVTVIDLYKIHSLKHHH